MPERTDRAIRDNWLPIGLILVVLGVAAGAGVVLWPRTVSQKQPIEGQSAVAQSAFRIEPLIVTLYFPAEGLLAAGTAAIPRQPDSQAQAREAIVALFKDQRASQAPVLKELRFKTVYLDAAGTAYVDLSLPREKSVKASEWEELTAVYALVNTLTQNFEEIKQVRFLIEGKEAQTLGHLDLSGMFVKRMDLVKQ